MALNEFKPTIWSDLIFMEYDKQLVFANLANREYEGEIQGYGDKVKINEIGDVTVRDYVQGTAITYESPKDASKYLLIDQQKYAALIVEDIDEAQSKPSIMGAISRKMGFQLADSMDQFIAGKYTEAGITSGLGTTASPISITSATVLNYLSLVAQKMDEANNPRSGRVAVVPPWFAQKLVLAKITKDTDNSEALASGYVGTIYGMDIYQSNNIVHSGTTWYAPMFFLANDTIAFAEQIMVPEAMRSQDQFGENLRTLVVYGGKVVRPNSLATLICAAGAES